MSSVIAVCVSFIGLASIIAVFVVFIQMILSFPAMLSSNSQTYIQQQRQYHHIPSHGALDSGYLATSSTTDGADAESESESEPEWVADEAVDRWIDDVDEQTNDCSSEVNHMPMYKTACLARGIEPITRGRPLRRQRRKHTSKTVFRLREDFDSSSRDSVGGRRPACVSRWRNVDWTR